MSTRKKTAKPASVKNPKAKTSNAKATQAAGGKQAKPVAETEGREIVIEFVEHSSAAESLQYLEVSRHDRAHHDRAGRRERAVMTKRQTAAEASRRACALQLACTMRPPERCCKRALAPQEIGVCISRGLGGNFCDNGLGWVFDCIILLSSGHLLLQDFGATMECLRGNAQQFVRDRILDHGCQQHTLVITRQIVVHHLPTHKDMEPFVRWPLNPPNFDDFPRSLDVPLVVLKVDRVHRVLPVPARLYIASCYYRADGL